MNTWTPLGGGAPGAEPERPRTSCGNRGRQSLEDKPAPAPSRLRWEADVAAMRAGGGSGGGGGVSRGGGLDGGCANSLSGSDAEMPELDEVRHRNQFSQSFGPGAVLRFPSGGRGHSFGHADGGRDAVAGSLSLTGKSKPLSHRHDTHGAPPDAPSTQAVKMRPRPSTAPIDRRTELPRGQRLELVVLSNWGDQTAVGLSGLEILNEAFSAFTDECGTPSLRGTRRASPPSSPTRARGAARYAPILAS